MSFQRERYQKYLKANGTYNTSPYCSCLDKIEKMVCADIDKEYDADKCASLLRTLLELRGTAGEDVKKYGQIKNLMSKLNKYCQFRSDPDRADGAKVVVKKNESAADTQGQSTSDKSEETFFNNNGMTAPMEHYIQQCSSFEQFEAQYLEQFISNDDRVGKYIEKLLWKYNKSQAEVSEDATLDRSYVGNIVRGRKNDPSRDALIAICLAIGTTVDEVQHLLWYAGHAPLYVRRKRDVIIWFGFMKKRSVTRVNNDLVANECPELMSKRKLAIDDDD